MSKILVTGGMGYIGSHTVVELQNKGFDVIIIDNLSNSKIEIIDGIEKITNIRPQFENFDICDKAKLSDFFNQNKNIVAIIHFAAYKAVGESVEQPLKYYHNNLSTLVNILDMMNVHKIDNFVFSSSCTVYGNTDKLPVTEKAPVKKALSPYGNTKQIAEEIIIDTVKSSNKLKAVMLRYFNPIGAHKSALIGELPIGVPNNLVPFITQTAIGIRKELKVFGNDYNTPDGSCVRDYIHVVDLAKAHVIAINRLIANKNKNSIEIFNIGTGKGSSVLEIVDTFQKVANTKLNYKIVERRVGDVDKVYGSTKYANNELCWKAKESLESMILSAWEWEKYYRKTLKQS